MHDPNQPEHQETPLSTLGSALLGLSVVLLALSLLSVWAVPAWQKAQRAARARATIADFKAFESAFQKYAHDRGDWPAAAVAPGEIPAGMESWLKGTRWNQRTSLGGRYAWLAGTMQRGQHLAAVVGVVSIANDAATDDPRQLQELLRQAKEAGLPANRLRLGYRNEPIYILEN